MKRQKWRVRLKGEMGTGRAGTGKGEIKSLDMEENNTSMSQVGSVCGGTCHHKGWCGPEQNNPKQLQSKQPPHNNEGNNKNTKEPKTITKQRTRKNQNNKRGSIVVVIGIARGSLYLKDKREKIREKDRETSQIENMRRDKNIAQTVRFM